jgi:hypothetical protein
MSDKSAATWHPFDGPPEIYRCAVCGEPQVIPSLARDCEARHERETKECQMRPEEDQ